MSTVEASSKTTHRRPHPRGHQPGPAPGRLQRLQVGPRHGRGGQPRGRRLGGRQDLRGRRGRRPRRRDRAGPARQREPAQAAHPRPLRQPGRHPRVPSLLARADAARHLARAPLAALARAPAGCPRRARRGVHVLLAGRGGGRLSDLDDLLRRPRAAQAAGAGRGVGAADPLRRLRPPSAAGVREGGLALRYGDDREAGRLRRARQHDRRQAPERGRPRRRVRDHGPQVVLLGAAVRRVPGAGAGRGRRQLLPDATAAAGRRAQPLPAAAAQGQARQPLERVVRDRVRRSLDPPGRRGGRRRPHDHRDGQPHQARLRHRQRDRDATRRRPGDQPRRPPLDLRARCWSSSR